jgi:hypothetical protein
LNVELPITRRFDALAYTPPFRELMREARRACREKFDRVDVQGAAQRAALEQAWAALDAALGEYGQNLPPADLVDRIREEARKAYAAAEQAEVPASASAGSDYEGERRRPVERDYALQQFRAELRELDDQLDLSSAALAGRPVMLLTGDPGTGKTHLLCDVAATRVHAGLPTVVVLGQQLGAGEVWGQILSRLRLQCTAEEFLGALESLAEAAGSRAFLLIDAINEASEIRWKDELPSLLAVLGRYPRVGLAVSCRSGYEANLVRSDLVSSGRMHRLVHDGFAPRML